MEMMFRGARSFNQPLHAPWYHEESEDESDTYPCQLGDSWWWSPGFGRDDCPEGGFFRRPAPRGDGDGVRTVR